MPPASLPVEARHVRASTLGYFAAFMGMGLAAASLGPALPTLAAQTSVTLQHISLLFTARSLGYLVGSLLSGRLYDRFPGHPLMATALLGMAGSMILAPFLPNLAVLLVVMAVLGVGESMLDVGGNTLLLWLYGRAVAPYMNGLHFFFGVGTFVAPVIIAQAALWGGGLRWAYGILALLMAPTAWWLVRLPSPTLRLDTTGAAAPANVRLVLLIALFLLFYVALELGFGGWIFTYAVTSGVASETSAAYLTSAYWGAFTLGRLGTIPLTTRVGPDALLLGSLLAGLLSLALLLPGQAISPWIGTIGLGLSLAAVFPVTLIWAERRMAMSSQVTCWFFVSVSVGGMLFPWLVGQFVTIWGPAAILYTLVGALIASLAVLIGLLAVARTCPAVPQNTPGER